jgi:hypothetical protein
MKATRIFIVLTATAAIFLATIGVAYGYYINNQTTVNANAPYTTDTSFWGWLGDCLGFGPNQPYGYPYQTPGNSTVESPTYVSPQQPYQPQGPNQGYYANGYGRGCWGW